MGTFPHSCNVFDCRMKPNAEKYSSQDRTVDYYMHTFFSMLSVSSFILFEGSSTSSDTRFSLNVFSIQQTVVSEIFKTFISRTQAAFSIFLFSLIFKQFTIYYLKLSCLYGYIHQLICNSHIFLLFSLTCILL